MEHIQVLLDTFTSSTPLGQKTFTNIVATLHPESPRRLVLGAHYDSKVRQLGKTWSGWGI